MISIAVLSIGGVTSLIFHIFTREPQTGLNGGTLERLTLTYQADRRGSVTPVCESSCSTEKNGVGVNGRSGDEKSQSGSEGSQRSSIWMPSPERECMQNVNSSSREKNQEEIIVQESRVFMYWNDWLLEPQFYQVCDTSFCSV